jgi:hypothetical protein
MLWIVGYCAQRCFCQKVELLVDDSAIRVMTQQITHEGRRQMQIFTGCLCGLLLAMLAAIAVGVAVQLSQQGWFKELGSG